jgi:hypothetical protein
VGSARAPREDVVRRGDVVGLEEQNAAVALRRRVGGA